MTQRDGVDAGSLAELQAHGMLLTKVGGHGVCVLWHDGRIYAVDDRCPHLGFPLHRGTVEQGLLTCHWHHARFDLCSGGTLDPFADDVRTYPVDVDSEGRVVVRSSSDGDRGAALLSRLDDGLEQGLTLVTAKTVIGLLEAGVPTAEIVQRGIAFGARHRRAGWGAGLTVLIAMANLLAQLDPADRALALVHGLAFVSRDTRGHPDRFPLSPLPTASLSVDQLTAWYRRFIDTRSDEAAERTLATAVAGSGSGRPEVERLMFAAVTDHVFLDGGHTLDFTNKAFEALDLLGWDAAGLVLPSLVQQTAAARRQEEEGAWRHPDDLAGLAASTASRLATWGPGLLEGAGLPDDALASVAWQLLDDDPKTVIDALMGALEAGATPEQVGRAVALAAGLRITRFHVQNDHGDWDVVHHGFTFANAVHQALARQPSVELLRGAMHGALKVYLDRFLNVPAARLPVLTTGSGLGDGPGPGDLADLEACWDEQGQVDRAGGIVARWVLAGGDPHAAVAVLGRALVAEDAGFHWFQTVEAAARQAAAWPDGSEPQALLLAGAARFLAAHTPTRRELPQVVRIALRLRRGEDLFEEI